MMTVGSVNGSAGPAKWSCGRDGGSVFVAVSEGVAEGEKVLGKRVRASAGALRGHSRGFASSNATALERCREPARGRVGFETRVERRVARPQEGVMISAHRAVVISLAALWAAAVVLTLAVLLEGA